VKKITKKSKCDNEKIFLKHTLNESFGAITDNGSGLCEVAENRSQ